MTLLQRVCSITEEPCIYDDNKNLVSVHRPQDQICFWHFQLAWTYLSGTSFTTDIYYCVDPTYQRGTHDINRPFVFKSNPNFIFHDSPGFETGDGVTTNCHFAHIFAHIFIYRTYIRCSFIGIQLLIISQTVSPLAWITRLWLLTGPWKNGRRTTTRKPKK